MHGEVSRYSYSKVGDSYLSNLSKVQIYLRELMCPPQATCPTFLILSHLMLPLHPAGPPPMALQIYDKIYKRVDLRPRPTNR